MKTQPMAMMRIALLALLAALPFQAVAQAQPPVGPSDDLADLAGVLVYDRSLRTGTLHLARPWEEQKVLEVLGAYPFGDREYLVNAGGPIVIIGINYDGIDLVDATDQIRVYRDRVCVETAPPQIQLCHLDSNDQYTTLVQLPDRKCKRTSDSPGSFCTENRKAWFMHKVWADDQCTVLDQEVTTYKLTCGN